MVCGVTMHSRASWAPDIPEDCWSTRRVTYCGTVRSTVRNTRDFSPISACSARLMAWPRRSWKSSGAGVGWLELLSVTVIASLSAPSAEYPDFKVRQWADQSLCTN